MSLPSGDWDAEHMLAFAPCFTDGQVFGFNPETVISVPIDPQTNRPPDVDEHGGHITPDPAAVARAVRMPICNACARRVGHASLYPLPKESTR